MWIPAQSGAEEKVKAGKAYYAGVSSKEDINGDGTLDYVARPVRGTDSYSPKLKKNEDVVLYTKKSNFSVYETDSSKIPDELK